MGKNEIRSRGEAPLAIVEEPSKSRVVSGMVAVFVGSFLIIALAASLVMPALISRTNIAPTEPKTAEEFLQTAISYKSSGWCEKSKAACRKAMALGVGTSTAERAHAFMKGRLPVKEVTPAAEQMNISAYNLEASGRSEDAKKVWLQCIDQYPDFEWSYSNLAGAYSDENDTVAATKYYEAALNLNPYYVNALTGLASIKMSKNNDAAAKELVQRALNVAPEDGTAQQISRLLQKRDR